MMELAFSDIYAGDFFFANSFGTSQRVRLRPAKGRMAVSPEFCQHSATACVCSTPTVFKGVPGLFLSINLALLGLETPLNIDLLPEPLLQFFARSASTLVQGNCSECLIQELHV